MKTYAPDYYPFFRCIAERCRHSCCIGWEIDIDPDTLARYRAVGGKLGECLKANIEENEEYACFRLGEDERCLFLNEKGLCELIIGLGEDALCEICAEHPRFRSYFDSRTEVGLGLCCEEAARLILTHPSKTSLILIADDGLLCEPSAEEADFFALREQVFTLLQDRGLPIDERLKRVLMRVGFDSDAILVDNGRWAAVYRSLEQLDPEWGKKLEAWQTSTASITKLPDTPEIELALEQLTVYFVYRHLSDALDDGRLAERVALAVLSTQTSATLAAIESAKGTRPLAALLEIARSYSAEVEYSTENVEVLLAELEK